MSLRVTLLAAIAAAAFATPVHAADKPNIVVILADDPAMAT
ncbi:MAG: hypothetical protein U0792_09030 [Gemmataceae bacterium]